MVIVVQQNKRCGGDQDPHGPLLFHVFDSGYGSLLYCLKKNRRNEEDVGLGPRLMLFLRRELREAQHADILDSAKNDI